MVMKTALVKDTFREIRKTIGRFISIFGIVLVGVAFLTGVKATSPYMKRSADAYFDRTEFMDLKVLSDGGLTDELIEYISSVEGVKKVQGIKSVEAEAVMNNSETVFQIFSYDFENTDLNLNKIELTEGRMPEHPGECVVRDYSINTEPAELGTEITFNTDSGLSEDTYTIVGRVSTPYYLSYQYDSTSVGSGKIGSVIFVPSNDLIMPVYTAAYVTVEGASEVNCYDDEYFDITDPVREKIEKMGFYVLDRNSHFSYVDYGNCGDRMDAIARVFPVFFYMVAALVCLTTMTRMVDEQRSFIGTMKALGYNRISISAKYIIYALSASLTGGVAGCLIGLNTLPKIIFDTWNIVYTVDGLVKEPQTALCITAVLIAVAVNVVTTIAVCAGELTETPSMLLRPKSPKNGKKIFLEYITPLWKRFSFTRKVTARNLFRYKKRFFMTVTGIAGCTALILAGFGIKNSVTVITKDQYGSIFAYDVLGRFGDDCDRTEFYNEYSVNDLIDDIYVLSVYTGSCSAEENNDTPDKNITLVSVDDAERYSGFTGLVSADNGKELIIPYDGVLITYKMAKDFGISEGGYVYADIGDGKYALKVKGIVKMHVGQYVFMCDDYFKSIFGHETYKNSFIANFYTDDVKKQEAVGNAMSDRYPIEGISYYNEISANFNKTIASLSIITVVMIISACLLAFVVLYNLITVNISERIREIATIKVLGFYDGEVSSYVYRENVILSVIGAAAGLLLGKILHGYIMDVIEMDDVIFPKVINWQSYIYAVIITVVFGICVNLSMNRKLKNIPMVESLKSVE